jgi:hypothetical protein
MKYTVSATFEVYAADEDEARVRFVELCSDNPREIEVE